MSALYFKYQAFDTEGKVQNGQLNAQSEREAIRILQGKNLTPVKLQETKRTFGRGLNKKISDTDILDFTIGLCTLVDAHVPIDKA